MSEYNIFTDKELFTTFKHWGEKEISKEIKDRMLYYFYNTDGTYDIGNVHPMVTQIVKMAVELANKTIDKSLYYIEYKSIAGGEHIGDSMQASIYRSGVPDCVHVCTGNDMQGVSACALKAIRELREEN